MGNPVIKQLRQVILPVEIPKDQYKKVIDYLDTVGFFDKTDNPDILAYYSNLFSNESWHNGYLIGKRENEKEAKIGKAIIETMYEFFEPRKEEG